MMRSFFEQPKNTCQIGGLKHHFTLKIVYLDLMYAYINGGNKNILALHV